MESHARAEHLPLCDYDESHDDAGCNHSQRTLLKRHHTGGCRNAWRSRCALSAARVTATLEKQRATRASPRARRGVGHDARRWLRACTSSPRGHVITAWISGASCGPRRFWLFTGSFSFACASLHTCICSGGGGGRCPCAFRRDNGAALASVRANVAARAV